MEHIVPKFTAKQFQRWARRHKEGYRNYFKSRGRHWDGGIIRDKKAPSLEFEREDLHDFVVARTKAREKRRLEAAIAAAERQNREVAPMFVVWQNDCPEPERVRHDDFDETAVATVNGKPIIEKLPNGMQRNGLTYGRVKAWHREMQSRRTDDLRAL